MIHVVFKIVLGYLIWRKFPSWLRLQGSRTIDHYVIVALSLIGVLLIISGVFHFVEYLLPYW